MRIVVSSSPGEVRVAAWDGGALRDYAIWRPGAPDGVGDLYRGRIIARVPAMAGAFVTLGAQDGFLPNTEGAAGEGTILGVRITRAAQGGKGTDRLWIARPVAARSQCGLAPRRTSSQCQGGHR